MLFTGIKPMLLSMRSESFDDDNFYFEPKWDGWRILLHKQGERVEAFTRHGNRVTDKFPELQAAGRLIRAHTAVLDCEGICMRGGRPVFDDFALRGRLTDPRKIARAAGTHPATFVAFDLITTDRDHIDEPLTDRKARLQELLEPGAVLTPTMYVDGQGKSLSRLTVQQELEGIVAKRKLSKYSLDVRSQDWIKVKNFKQADVVILGYRREPQFALVVGLQFPTVSNKPVAVVEFGFKPEEKKAFLAIAKQIHTKKDGQTQWIEPKLCCQVQYLERTERHHLRITSFKGFLFDKRAEDCRWVS